MILSGHEIRSQLGGNIVIDPFDDANLNPNSYNLTLHDELMTYEEVVLDMRKANRVRRLTIPPDGLVLSPNQLYLAETHNLVPMIEGRSSIGRLGLFVHVTAGFGDVGFCGFWTLEMFAVQPVRIYAGVQICQIIYHQILGDVAVVLILVAAVFRDIAQESDLISGRRLSCDRRRALVSF
jgi:dCTP deaminase